MAAFLLNKGTQIKVREAYRESLSRMMTVIERDLNKVLGSSDYYRENKIEIEIDQGLNFSKETFHLEVLNEDCLKISSIDVLGAIYGLLYISKTYLGIDDWWCFTGKEPNIKNVIKIDENYQSKASHVPYRGWFVNDEVLLMGWQEQCTESSVWEHVFETLLRLGGNMIIAGTGENGHKLREIAGQMGLWLTHHHAEPLGARMFLNVYPDEEASYIKNAPLFEGLWREAVEIGRASCRERVYVLV